MKPFLKSFIDDEKNFCKTKNIFGPLETLEVNLSAKVILHRCSNMLLRTDTGPSIFLKKEMEKLLENESARSNHIITPIVINYVSYTKTSMIMDRLLFRNGFENTINTVEPFTDGEVEEFFPFVEEICERFLGKKDTFRRIKHDLYFVSYLLLQRGKVFRRKKQFVLAGKFLLGSIKVCRRISKEVKENIADFSLHFSDICFEISQVYKARKKYDKELRLLVKGLAVITKSNEQMYNFNDLLVQRKITIHFVGCKKFDQFLTENTNRVCEIFLQYLYRLRNLEKYSKDLKYPFFEIAFSVDRIELTKQVALCYRALGKVNKSLKTNLKALELCQLCYERSLKSWPYFFYVGKPGKDKEMVKKKLKSYQHQREIEILIVITAIFHSKGNKTKFEEYYLRTEKLMEEEKIEADEMWENMRLCMRLKFMGKGNFEKVVKNCNVCRKVAAKKCGRCNLIYYCSYECQKSHWNEHKKVCVDIKKQELK